jgi:protein-L-isoaspartate O-methyltransferase
MIRKVEPYKGIAGIYEEIRPSYPEKLIEDIICKAHLKVKDKLLEIGAGTGKATIQFAEKGFSIDAIEIGEDMAEVLKDKCSIYSNVSIDVISFEEWNNPNNQKYDMIYSAQAFHWLDKNIKYTKCHELLNDNGYLILFWYNPIEFGSDRTIEIQEKVDLIVNKYISKHFNEKRKFERLEHDGVYKEDDRKTEINSSGLFELTEKIDYIHEIQNNADQYLKAMKSVPAFASILDGLDDNIIENMDNEIKELINNHGGYVGTLFNFSLYITKKI